MTGPTPHKPIPPELSAHVLHEARQKFATLMARRNHRPLWNCSFTAAGLGIDGSIEILPSLVFRVRDRKTGETLAQTLPVSFGPRDPSNLDLSERWNAWCEERRALAMADAQGKEGGL